MATQHPFYIICIASFLSFLPSSLAITSPLGVLSPEDGEDWAECAKHRDDFGELGFRCCPDEVSVKKSPLSKRDSGSYCGEITAEQELFKKDVESGKIQDVLQYYVSRGLHADTQAKCGSRNGFLVGGLPILETPSNSVLLRNQHKCAHFGTNLILATIEWLGRRVTDHFKSQPYPPKLVVGDLGRPKGGAIRSGHRGRMAHRSHQNGLDADLGFLTPIKNAEWRFHSNFLVGANWWFLRRLAENPFACPMIVYLDRKHIRALKTYVDAHPSQTPLWNWYRTRLIHEKGHANHFHVRVVADSGACSPEELGPELVGNPEWNEPEITQKIKAKLGTGSKARKGKSKRGKVKK